MSSRGQKMGAPVERTADENRKPAVVTNAEGLGQNRGELQQQQGEDDGEEHNSMSQEQLVRLRACDGCAHSVRSGVQNDDDGNRSFNILFEPSPEGAKVGMTGRNVRDLCGPQTEQCCLCDGAKERDQQCDQDADNEE